MAQPATALVSMARGPFADQQGTSNPTRFEELLDGD